MSKTTSYNRIPYIYSANLNTVFLSLSNRSASDNYSQTNYTSYLLPRLYGSQMCTGNSIYHLPSNLLSRLNRSKMSETEPTPLDYLLSRIYRSRLSHALPTCNPTPSSKVF